MAKNAARPRPTSSRPTSGTARIDTVLVVFGDHQGRLIGKRTDGEFYLDVVARGGHRELRLPDRLRPRQQPDPRVPVGELRPGLRRHARRRRHGDHPLPAVARHARRWCSSTSSTSTPARRSRCRRAASCRHQVDKAAAARLRADDRQRDRVLPVQGGLRRRQRRRLPRGSRRTRRTSRTTTSSRRPRRRTCSARSGAGSRGAGFPVEFSKGEAGKGQHELNLTYQTAVEMADINLVFKNAVKEIAALSRQVGDVHGQAALRRRRLELPHPLEPVGRHDGADALMPTGTATTTTRTT